MNIIAYYKLCCSLVLMMLISFVCNAQKGVLLGGGVSVKMPDNGFGNDNFGFADAAKIGGGVNFSTLWFFNPRLSLSSELGYSYFPKNEKTWNQRRRGEIKVNYQMVNLNAQGNFYIGEENTRPYFGVVFGLYFLRNMVNFDSNYTGTTNDASVSYVSKTFHAGFGPEIGALFEIGKNQYANLGLRYTIIPNIEAEYHLENNFTSNPHGKQNHWELNAKLYFGR